MRLARESWILIVICLADLVTTLWLVSRYGASEGNGLMRYYLGMGTLPFIFAKFVMFGAPLLVLEWARRHRPAFVRNMMRCAILLYVGMYGVGVWRINHAAVADAAAEVQAESLARMSVYQSELRDPNSPLNRYYLSGGWQAHVDR